MKKITSLFKKIEQSFILKIITCFVLSFMVIILFFIINRIVSTKNNRKYSITNDFELINQIEDIKIEDKKISIKGYAFLLNMDSNDIKISIFLRNKNNGIEIWADVKQISRKDVSNFYSKDFNLENSGFSAIIKNTKLNEDESYEIVLKLDYKDKDNKKTSKTVSTNRYIVNNKLYSYDPEDFIHPNIKSDLLRDVFNNGQLCFYQSDEGMFVYQYKDQLYWIVDESFNIDKDDMITIPCNVYTSRKDKLPEDRIESGFDTRGFKFEAFEYIGDDIAPYRVAVWDIPDDYPITYITTGKYDSGWVWSRIFHITNKFD